MIKSPEYVIQDSLLAKVHSMSLTAFIAIVLGFTSIINAHSQTADCTYQEDSANYAKALGFLDTHQDSFKKYASKFISSQNEPCDDFLIINFYIESWKRDLLLRLAEMENLEGNYLKSIEYLDVRNSQSTRYGEHYTPTRQIARLYGSNYHNIDSSEVALRHLLPHVIWGFTKGEPRKLIGLCNKILIEEYEKEILIEELQKSILKFYKKDSDYYIQYIGVEIKLLGFKMPWGYVDAQEQVSLFLENQYFYKLLVE